VRPGAAFELAESETSATLASCVVPGEASAAVAPSATSAATPTPAPAPAPAPSQAPARRHPPAIEAALQAGQGLWWLRAADGADGPHLAWNIAAAPEELQLYVRTPDGARRLVRARVGAADCWKAAPWVRPGVAFELATSEQAGTLAACVVPDEAPVAG
jgi:hypothetical protein